MRIILLGAPGVGKGTQAKLISENFRIPHISTGDLFRSNINEGTALGIQAKEYIQKGGLVPDSLTISLVKNRLKKEDCNDGFLLDGFPRNINQAKELDLILSRRNQSIDTVLFINLPNNLILDRITGRRFCAKCGSSYHIKFNPSKAEDKCQICGHTLEQRPDDKEEVVRERLSIYNKATKPLVDYYSGLGILCDIQGEADISDVFSNICGLLQLV